MTLTEQQIRIISENPLNDTLDRFQVKLHDCDETDQTYRDEIASLLGALVGSTAAYLFPSPDASGNVAMKLFPIQQQVQGGGMTLEPFRPLACHVINKAADIDIWEAVFSLIETISALTPPPSSIASTSNGTPVKSNSNWVADSANRDIVERALFFEIGNCVYRDVGGFCEKFFDSKRWCKENKQMLNEVMTEHNGKKWKDFPSDPVEEPIWKWLCALEERFLAVAPNKLYTTQSAYEFKERKGQVDIFFQKPTTTLSYKNVLVVGEQKRTDDTGKFKANLLQLTRHVRSVFADQPTRRFVHGFTFCGSNMELWVFDRSGPYSSGSFDIHTEPIKFARALVGYATMDDEALGLDTFIERNNGHRYVNFEDTDDRKVRFELKKLLVRQRAVVCRGTTCFRTQNGHVAKFSWASDKRKPEVEHFELAAKSGVKGVTRVEAYRQITTISDLRKGLAFPKPHRFQGLEDTPSCAGDSSIAQRRDKRKSSSGDTGRSKRPRSNNQKSKLKYEIDEQLSSYENKPSLYTANPEDPFENRVYSCLVVSPAGRVISDFSTVIELLETLRDAIKAHQSLYNVGNILHRDISSNNIIITDPKTADGFKGMLIDLDLAKVRDSGPSGARHQTGTMQFMAIEVLRNVDHTYRHDLESFLYVLLWMCARHSWIKGFGGEEEPPEDSVLQRWEIGTFKDIASAKWLHMRVDGIQEVLDEFPEVFNGVKPLCRNIRTILFGKTATLGIGTPVGKPDLLYNAILAAYNKAIHKLLRDQ